MIKVCGTSYPQSHWPMPATVTCSVFSATEAPLLLWISWSHYSGTTKKIDLVRSKEVGHLQLVHLPDSDDHNLGSSRSALTTCMCPRLVRSDMEAPEGHLRRRSWDRGLP